MHLSKWQIGSAIAPYHESTMTGKVFDFGSENESVARLYMQHFIIREQLGFLLPPSIDIDRANLRIADLACGCGIWLAELAKRLRPDAQLHGYDVSPAHFPAPQEMPANVQFSTLDCLGPLPDQSTGAFDIVHCRGLMLYVADGDPSGLLRNQMAMLKPGGVLFWEELDVVNMYVRSQEGQYPNCEKYCHYGKSWMRACGIDASWTSNMPAILDREGLKAEDSCKVAFDDVLAKPWTVMQAMATRDFIKNDIIPTCATDPHGLSPAEWTEVMEKFPEECQAGARVVMDLSYVVARKPLA